MPNARRIGLGTVQFGMSYGVSNLHGQVERPMAAQILRTAREAGVRLLDTAAQYGESEEVLGELAAGKGFRIITKTLAGAQGVDKVVERARKSHDILGGRPIHGLLVHSAADLRASDGPALWAALLDLRDKGLFERIGFSAYAAEDLVELARRYRPDIMQLPLSVLDQRLARTGILGELKELGVEIHVRSVFLQGAIFLDPARLPAGLAHARSKLEAFHSRLRRHALSPLQAAIAYPLSIPEIDVAIVGVTTDAEARQVLDAAALPPADVPWPDLAVDDEVLLDPRRWTVTPPSRRPIVLAVLQARMSSSRLPGKVLKPILGRPMMGRHIDRLKRCKLIDRLVVATSIEATDDPIAAFCAAESIDCYRGSLNDVLARFEGAAAALDPVDHVVRLTADCPLADPQVIDEVINMHLTGRYDYSANINPPTFPDGLDTEVITRRALRATAAEASSAFDREHVTPFVRTRPDRFKLGNFENNVDQSHMRWTVDTEADFHLVEAVYRELLPGNGAFGSSDILALLERRPDIAAINSRAAP